MNEHEDYPKMYSKYVKRAIAFCYITLSQAMVFIMTIALFGTFFVEGFACHCCGRSLISLDTLPPSQQPVDPFQNLLGTIVFFIPIPCLLAIIFLGFTIFFYKKSNEYLKKMPKVYESKGEKRYNRCVVRLIIFVYIFVLLFFSFTFVLIPLSVLFCVEDSESLIASWRDIFFSDDSILCWIVGLALFVLLFFIIHHFTKIHEYRVLIPNLVKSTKTNNKDTNREKSKNYGGKRKKVKFRDCRTGSRENKRMDNKDDNGT